MLVLCTVHDFFLPPCLWFLQASLRYGQRSHCRSVLWQIKLVHHSWENIMTNQTFCLAETAGSVCTVDLCLPGDACWAPHKLTLYCFFVYGEGLVPFRRLGNITFFCPSRWWQRGDWRVFIKHCPFKRMYVTFTFKSAFYCPALAIWPRKKCFWGMAMRVPGKGTKKQEKVMLLCLRPA